MFLIDPKQVGIKGSSAATMDVVIGHQGSPFATAYQFSGGFGSKYSNPSTLPTNAAYSLAFRPWTYLPHQAIAMGGYVHSFSMIVAYPWTLGTGFGTQYNFPSGFGSNSANGLAWNPAGTEITTASQSPPRTHSADFNYYTALPFGSARSAPTSGPADLALGCAYSSSGTYFAVAHANNSAPRLWVTTMTSSGYGSKVSDPATSPTSHARGVQFSYGDADIVSAGQGSPYIDAWAWSSGFGSKRSNPSSGPGSTARSVTFTPSGDTVFCSEDSSPYIHAWAWSSGFGTKKSNPSSLPSGYPGYGEGIQVSDDETLVFMATYSSPYINVYDWNGNFGTKYSNPSTLPAGQGNALTVSAGY